MQQSFIKKLLSITVLVICTISAVFIVSCSVGNTGQHGAGDVVPLGSTLESQYFSHPISDPQRQTSLGFSSSISIPKTLASSRREEVEKLMNYIDHCPEQKILSDFGRAAMKANSWQEVDKLARECITKTTGTLPAFYIHQMVASTMLQTYFLLHKPTPDIQGAVGYYMDILIKYENYSKANLKAACLPMLMGYWSNEKIADAAQKNFSSVVFHKITKENFLYDYSQKRYDELKKYAPEQYAQMTSSQFATKVQADLETVVLTFPKRSKPFPDLIHDTDECLKFDKDTPESIAILALLAQGKFASTTNK
ncbi:MAG: hypothetical protein ACOVSW_11530 [Candidatus Kapaibacteriota bacterium]|jgi:hypothetical protein